MARAGAGVARRLASVAIGAGLAAAAATPLPAADTAPRMMAMTALNRPFIPARAADGGFRTINYGIDAPHRLWHVRAALNVAALGCEGADRAATIAAYNRFLTTAKAPLAAANAAIVAGFKAQYGPGWAARYDLYMTSLYNYFSQPFVKSAFCAAAHPIAQETATVTAATAATFAAGALPRLEAPFTAFYARYAAYELALADYNDRYSTGRARGAAPVSPLLDYAALDLGDAGQATAAASSPAAGAIRRAVPALAPMPVRLARADVSDASVPRTQIAVARLSPAEASKALLARMAAAQQSAPEPVLDYELPK